MGTASTASTAGKLDVKETVKSGCEALAPEPTPHIKVPPANVVFRVFSPNPSGLGMMIAPEKPPFQSRFGLWHWSRPEAKVS